MAQKKGTPRKKQQRKKRTNKVPQHVRAQKAMAKQIHPMQALGSLVNESELFQKLTILIDKINSHLGPLKKQEFENEDLKSDIKDLEKLLDPEGALDDVYNIGEIIRKIAHGAIAYDKAHKTSYREDLFTTYVNFLMETMRPNQALELIFNERKRIENSGQIPPDSFFETLASALFHTGDYESAARIMEGIIDARTIKGHKSDTDKVHKQYLEAKRLAKETGKEIPKHLQELDMEGDATAEEMLALALSMKARFIDTADMHTSEEMMANLDRLKPEYRHKFSKLASSSGSKRQTYRDEEMNGPEKNFVAEELDKLTIKGKFALNDTTVRVVGRGKRLEAMHKAQLIEDKLKQLIPNN